MAPIDPRKNIPVSDARWTSGEDVEAHGFRAHLDTSDEQGEQDVEAHRFMALDTGEQGEDDVEAHRFLGVLDTTDGQSEEGGEAPLRTL